MSDTETLVREWQDKSNNLERAAKGKRFAETDLTNATNALVKQMSPKDAKPGESFCTWVRFPAGSKSERLLVITTESTEGDELRSASIKFRE